MEEVKLATCINGHERAQMERERKRRAHLVMVEKKAFFSIENVFLCIFFVIYYAAVMSVFFRERPESAYRVWWKKRWSEPPTKYVANMGDMSHFPISIFLQTKCIFNWAKNIWAGGGLNSCHREAIWMLNMAACDNKPSVSSVSVCSSLIQRG